MKRWNLEKSAEFEIADLEFRLDIYAAGSEPGVYRIRLSRIETFRLKPRFGPDQAADSDLYVVDPFLDGEVISANSAEEAMVHAVARLEKQMLG